VTASIAEHKAEIMDICRRYGVKRLELFGSAAAEGRESPDSDLDFLVDFGSRTTPGYADAYFGLSEALENLFKRPINLVVESAIRNPYFLESVRLSKTLLYAA
jgi:predicted nucleotidyltransferase